MNLKKLIHLSHSSARAPQRGSALVVSLITLAVLAFAAAALSVSVSTTANVSLQAATWQEAIMAAEAGADTALASLRVALDEGSVVVNGTTTSYWNDAVGTPPVGVNALTDFKTGATAWNGWTIDSVDASNFPTKLSREISLRTASGTITGMKTAVTIDRLLGDPTGKPWYRVRATGISGISGPARVGLDKRDNDLRKISLAGKRPGRSGYKQPTTLGTAEVTRSIEVLVHPLKSGTWDRAITANSTVQMGAKFIVDSWDSSNTSKYPGGAYPSSLIGVQTTNDPVLNALRQRNAEVVSNLDGSDVNIGGAYLYGAVKCNGGTPKATQNVTGAISNNFYTSIGAVKAPTWSSWTNTPTAIVNTNTTLDTGSDSSPAKYVLSNLSLNNNTLTFNANNGGGSGSGQGNTNKRYVELYLTKDATLSNNAKIIIPANVHVTMYIAGKLSGTGASFVNESGNAANLTIWGISTPDKTTPQWAWNSDADFIGTINGPDVKFKVTGVANFYGAIICNTVDFGGSDGAGYHFDEALLKNGGATPRYQVASWIEDVR